MTAAEIAKALGKHRRVGREWECLCPAHNDHNPSLSIGEEDGKILVHCFAGCDQTAVIGVLKQRGLWPQTESQQNEWDRTQEQKRSAEIIYRYADESGQLLFEVVRKGHGLEKTFFQRAPDGSGGWIRDKKGKLTIEGVRRVLYHLPQLIEAAAKHKGVAWRVFFTEGEGRRQAR